MPGLPENPSPEDPTAEYERRFPRRLLFASAAAGAATIAAVGGASPADAATATTTWKLGGNTDVSSTNFLGAIGAGQNLIFKTRASSSSTVSEKMRLTAKGQLGIGITAPAAKLDVTTSSPVAVQGTGTGTGTDARGVVGTASKGTGVQGTGYLGVSGYGTNTGVYGKSDNIGVSGIGFYGVFGQSNGEGWGVYAVGDARVTGTLSKAAGSFLIDHPLDPDNKWLSHSFVESPDMMNVYNGNVTTDTAGGATVALPSYFQALNRDFRYQLTVIGQAAQAFVSAEVANNAFSITTDRPGVKVSWQVTGIRQDSYAKEHPIVVEKPKDTADRGTRQFVPKGSSAKPMQVGPAAL